MGEMHDAWFFVGVLVFIFLIWIATGGPTHPLSFAGPSLNQPEELGGGTYLNLPRAPFKIGVTPVTLTTDYVGRGNTYTTGISGSNSIYGIPFGTPSPYRNMVSLVRHISNASSTNEYVELSVMQNSSQSVNITGWTLESAVTGKAEIIPKGTRVPTSGVVNATEDIILDRGERAIINTGPSPVGASFRENKCTGYFASFQKFYPSLSKSCPSPSSELLAYYGTPYIHDPACIDYTKTLSRCEVPNTRLANINMTCEAFIENTLSYNGCLNFHRSDSDFAGNTWRIYLNLTDKKGKTKPMWRTKYEVVKLLDERGKTVAMFTY